MNSQETCNGILGVSRDDQNKLERARTEYLDDSNKTKQISLKIPCFCGYYGHTNILTSLFDNVVVGGWLWVIKETFSFMDLGSELRSTKNNFLGIEKILIFKRTMDRLVLEL